MLPRLRQIDRLVAERGMSDDLMQMEIVLAAGQEVTHAIRTQV